MVELVALKDGAVAAVGSGRVLPAAEAAVLAEAQALLAEARRHADDIVAAARAETNAIREAARAEGLAAAENEIQDRLFAIAEASASVISRTEERIVEMGLQIARRIIGSLDAADVDTRVALRSLKLSSNSGFIRLRVAPGGADGLREQLDRIAPASLGSAQIEVVPDPRIRDRGCVMETDAGLIEATVESQLAAIERGLRRSLATASGKEGGA